MMKKGRLAGWQVTTFVKMLRSVAAHDDNPLTQLLQLSVLLAPALYPPS